MAAAYRLLSVLLPQAPLPLSTLQQLWGCAGLAEAGELVQIFVLQGVAKMATLPDGNAWVLVSSQHQEYLKVRGQGMQGGRTEAGVKEGVWRGSCYRVGRKWRTQVMMAV
jgi:hypothetical protein